MVNHFCLQVIKHIPYCACGEKGILSEKYDAYFCPISFIWLEELCEDSTCEFCKIRPINAQEFNHV